MARQPLLEQPGAPKHLVEHLESGLYVDEKDPAIVDELVDLPDQSAQPEAKKVLSNLKSNTNAAANPQLAARISSSIEWIKTLPSPTPKTP